LLSLVICYVVSVSDRMFFSWFVRRFCTQKLRNSDVRALLRSAHKAMLRYGCQSSLTFSISSPNIRNSGCFAAGDESQTKCYGTKCHRTKMPPDKMSLGQNATRTIICHWTKCHVRQNRYQDKMRKCRVED